MAESSIRVIVRAVKILDCFVGARSPLGITDLSKEMRLSKSTVHHVVTTLVGTGLLASDGASRRYRLGPKLAHLGNAFIQSTDLRDLARRRLIELRDLTDETASLHLKFGTQRIISDQVVSTHGIRRVLTLGLGRPIYIGAVGIVLMGDMSDRDILRMLKRSRPEQLTPRTVTNPQEILKLVQAARADGWAPLSSVRQALGKRMPGFNLRNYKHRKFRDLVAAVDGIETRESQSASGPVISVRHLAPPPA